jgi:hypothetical protein
VPFESFSPRPAPAGTPPIALNSTGCAPPPAAGTASGDTNLGAAAVACWGRESGALRISTMWIAALAVLLVPALEARAAHSKTQVVAWDGYVYDSGGRPVKGVLVTIGQGSYTTRGETEWFALGFPKASGAAVWYDPDVVKTHYVNYHFAKTDHNGHFEFRNISPGRYDLSVRGMKKYFGDFKTSEPFLEPDKKLLATYKFPPATQAVYDGGRRTLKPIVLLPK